MIIYKESAITGVIIGLNDYNELFLGDGRSGYTLPNTPTNRDYIENDYRKRCK